MLTSGLSGGLADIMELPSGITKDPIIRRSRARFSQDIQAGAVNGSGKELDQPHSALLLIVGIPPNCCRKDTRPSRTSGLALWIMLDLGKSSQECVDEYSWPEVSQMA